MATQFERIRRNFNYRIEEPVRKHLRNVYGCIAMSAASAAVGTYIHMYTALVSAGFLSFIASLGLFLALHLTPPNGKNNNLRLAYLLGFAFFAGVGMGPIVNFAIDIDPSIVVTALIGTILVFTCFTLSVLFAPRGYWLFIGGPISTLLSSLLIMSLANIFFASSWLYQANLYIGLLTMCGFVVYDTTVIMEKCRMGNKDFILHSIELFIDLMMIFKRIVALLLEKERTSKSRSKNSDK